MNYRPVVFFNMDEDRILTPSGCMFVSDDEKTSSLAKSEPLSDEHFMDGETLITSFYLLRQSMRTQSEELVEAFDSACHDIATKIHESEDNGVEKVVKMPVGDHAKLGKLLKSVKKASKDIIVTDSVDTEQ